MKIIDLPEEYESKYFVCLEDWSDEMQEAGNYKKIWYRQMKEKGLAVKLALNEEEKPVGMIQYLPIEHSWVEGRDLYFVLCIWVHGYKGKGVGNYQKQGIGKSLLRAAELDVERSGAKGIAAWGVPLPVFMKASWFRKQGYVKADKEGFPGTVLLWKPFAKDATPPQWKHSAKKPEISEDHVTVTGLISGWCPAHNMVIERAKRATREFGDQVVFHEIDTLDRETYNDWGISDALYIDGKGLNTGPPPSYRKIKKKIAKAVRNRA